jgi:two-component system, LytTR family, sensor kinase
LGPDRARFTRVALLGLALGLAHSHIKLVPRLLQQLRWPRFDLRVAAWLLLLFAGVGLAQGALIVLFQRQSGVHPQPFLIVFQVTGAVGAWAATPFAQLAALNAPAPARTLAANSGTWPVVVQWLAFLSVHALGYLGFTAAHIAWIRGLRGLLFVSGLVHVADGPLGVRALWEMQNDMVVYAGAAALLTIAAAWRERDESALRTTALEARLSEARLAALAAQVDPHFFYNALNTVSATMYEDVERSDRYLSHLADIMRATLRQGEPSWSLEQERAHTERYVELLQPRFGARLLVRWRQPAAVSGVVLPRFAVQTLVENAIKHNAKRREPLALDIDVAAAGTTTTTIEVRDDGVGFAQPGVPGGRGLSRLSEMLRLLHGPSAALEFGNNPSGGACVRLRVPRASP